MQKGFQSETYDSQAIFRTVLDAMATPGRIMELPIKIQPPQGIDPAAGAILMMLLDFETPLWSNLDHDSAAIQWLRFHTGTPFTQAKKKSAFVLCTDYEDLGDLEDYSMGTIESPHQSTTLIVQTKGIVEKGALRLTGPGIQTHTDLKLTGIANRFFKKRARILDSYPLGVDLIFVCGTVFVAIPRTTKVAVL
jgi:alpha-D-ribose 1-methylphosphonate 5-triphosphate synthase subunit PhnH